MKSEKNSVAHEPISQEKSHDNIAFVVNDKVLLSLYFRYMLLGHTIVNGHVYANKKVIIYKNKAFLDSDGTSDIVFIPCMLIDDDMTKEPKLIPFPAFMLRLSHSQIMETIGYLKKTGYDNLKKDYFKLFFKPKVSMNYEDRVDLGAEYFEAENEDCHLQLSDERPSDLVIEEQIFDFKIVN